MPASTRSEPPLDHHGKSALGELHSGRVAGLTTPQQCPKMVGVANRRELLTPMVDAPKDGHPRPPCSGISQPSPRSVRWSGLGLGELLRTRWVVSSLVARSSLGALPPFRLQSVGLD